MWQIVPLFKTVILVTRHSQTYTHTQKREDGTERNVLLKFNIFMTRLIFSERIQNHKQMNRKNKNNKKKLKKS